MYCINKQQLNFNALDYGYVGHLGIRMNPLKLSFGLSYSTRQLEPDSQIFDLFYENPVWQSVGRLFLQLDTQVINQEFQFFPGKWSDSF